MMIKMRGIIGHKELRMLSAHHFWTEFKFMCLLIACAVMIGILSESGTTEGDQRTAQPSAERTPTP